MPSLTELWPRVLRARADLRMLSEAQAARSLEVVQAPSTAGGSPAPPGFNLTKETVHRDDVSLYDELEAKLEELLENWLVQAEVARDRHRYRQPGARQETDQEWGDRIVREDDETPGGRNDLDVAMREGTSRWAVQRARQRRGRTARRGLKRSEDEPGRIRRA